MGCIEHPIEAVPARDATREYMRSISPSPKSGHLSGLRPAAFAI